MRKEMVATTNRLVVPETTQQLATHYSELTQDTDYSLLGIDGLLELYKLAVKLAGEGKIAWEGENKCSRVKLFLTTWVNPAPEKQIVALDYATTNSTPFCVAITAEQ